MPYGTLYLIPVPLAEEAAAKSFTLTWLILLTVSKSILWRMKKPPAAF
jgi:hypothetical protein